MKFNREHLEELTLQKIKEVNDEAGYRSYLEVPEMVNIVASIIEEKLKACYVSAKVFYDMRKQLGEEIDDWKGCADKLIHFAEIVREVEGNDVRNPHYYDSACKAIKEYIELKNETQSNG